MNDGHRKSRLKNNQEESYAVPLYSRILGSIVIQRNNDKIRECKSEEDDREDESRIAVDFFVEELLLSASGVHPLHRNSGNLPDLDRTSGPFSAVFHRIAFLAAPQILWQPDIRNGAHFRWLERNEYNG